MRVLARAGDTQALVDVVDIDDGGSTITGYQVTSNPGGIIASGATLPITVSGLTNGVTYTFTATVTNASVRRRSPRRRTPSGPSRPRPHLAPGLRAEPLRQRRLRDRHARQHGDHASAGRRRPHRHHGQPRAERVYVANADDDTLSVIDTTTMQVIATIPVEIGPSGNRGQSAGTKVYVSNSGSDSVSVIDAATNAVTTTITGVTAPRGLVVSPTVPASTWLPDCNCAPSTPPPIPSTSRALPLGRRRASTSLPTARSSS
jgi:YVTN family beta-propeller protein